MNLMGLCSTTTLVLDCEARILTLGDNTEISVGLLGEIFDVSWFRFFALFCVEYESSPTNNKR